MLFSVTLLAVFSAVALACNTDEGGVKGLREPVACNSAAGFSAATSDFLMKTEITCDNAEAIHWLLKNADLFCVQRYNNIKEGPERLAQLLEPRLLEDRRYQETLYPPPKLLANLDLARAFFGPGGNKGSQGKEEEKEKEKGCDGEPLKSVKHGDDEVEVESIDGLPGRMGGLKISEQPFEGIESTQYGAIFFGVRRLYGFFMGLRRADRGSTMPVHPDPARAFFGPGGGKGSQGKGEEKEKEKGCDGEPLKSVEHSDDEVKVDSIDDLLGEMGGLKISEQPSKEIKSIQYGGIFFEARLPKLLVELYKADRELAMHIVGFVIEHQMDYMNSPNWLEFLRIASLEDQLSVIDMLAPHEMTPDILWSLNYCSGLNSQELVSRYLDKNLPENELLVRCAIAREAKVFVSSKCNDLLGKTTDKDLMDILEGREDRPSRMTLFRMVRKLGLKNDIEVLLKAVFYKLTPCNTKFLAMFEKLDPIQKAALKSDVPPYLWPYEYQPLDCRLKKWLTLDGPYEYVEETEIPQEQFDSTKPHFALNTYITTAAAERIRVADYFVERAKDLLKSPMLAMEVSDFELMLTALGYLLADGRQLDCSNFFVDLGDDSSWDDSIEKFEKRIWKCRDGPLCKNSIGFSILDDRLLGVWWFMPLQKFRSLVDSSYRGQISEQKENHSLELSLTK
jgi:hypothetical protein